METYSASAFNEPAIAVLFFVLWILFILTAIFIPQNELLPVEVDDIYIEKLKKKLKTYQILAGLFFYISVPAITFFLVKIMFALQNFQDKNALGVRYKIASSQEAFAIPIIFIGLLIYLILVNHIGTMFARTISNSREEFQIFMYGWTKKMIFGLSLNLKVFSLILTVFILPFFLFLFYLSFDDYVKITNTHIIYNGYFDLKDKIYSYSEVDKIYMVNISSITIRSKKAGKNPESYYIFTMKDNLKLNSLNWNVHKTEKEEEIANYISQISGVPIENK